MKSAITSRHPAGSGHRRGRPPPPPPPTLSPAPKPRAGAPGEVAIRWRRSPSWRRPCDCSMSQWGRQDLSIAECKCQGDSSVMHRRSFPRDHPGPIARLGQRDVGHLRRGERMRSGNTNSAWKVREYGYGGGLGGEEGSPGSGWSPTMNVAEVPEALGLVCRQHTAGLRFSWAAL
ncbi:hypothetical protein GGTG_01797 [Gaeumannomyces tritici R3-111a-1]|uniref:Uncharacterized protein n=1 Tax=Gaeumannomyces tritici (strain R3-111a-1) TaxID=644352 RepID=J3NKK6_GAET3|nr:hypothetical protein GGTG_01797 [Gaeumannomyces tritici R3-111a-1]EJT81823.1 hypothetical protein GGTG_01797 [Gaeumannomyces tritici R3-111a-1]